MDYLIAIFICFIVVAIFRELLKNMGIVSSQASNERKDDTLNQDSFVHNTDNWYIQDFPDSVNDVSGMDDPHGHHHNQGYHEHDHNNFHTHHDSHSHDTTTFSDSSHSHSHSDF